MQVILRRPHKRGLPAVLSPTTTAARFPAHRRLNGAVVPADVVHNSGDAEGAGEAQQVGQEAECDAEDERSAKGLPQGLPDHLGTQRRRSLGPLKEHSGGKRASACREP